MSNRGVLFAVHGELVVTFANVLADKEERAVGELLLVHSGKCVSSRSRVFEADESTSLGFLNMSRKDLSVFCKHSG